MYFILNEASFLLGTHPCDVSHVLAAGRRATIQQFLKWFATKILKLSDLLHKVDKSVFSFKAACECNLKNVFRFIEPSSDPSALPSVEYIKNHHTYAAPPPLDRYLEIEFPFNEYMFSLIPIFAEEGEPLMIMVFSLVTESKLTHQVDFLLASLIIS